jgi:hypothetical protein
MGISGVLVLAFTSFYAGKGSTWPVLVGAAITLVAFSAALAGKGGGARRAGLIALSALSASGTVFYLWTTDGLLTWVLGLGWATVLLVAARYTREDTSKFLGAFLGVSVALASLNDIMVLAGLSLSVPMTHTDAKNMAAAFGGAPIMWAVLWGVIAVTAVAATGGFLVWDAWRKR